MVSFPGVKESKTINRISVSSSVSCLSCIFYSKSGETNKASLRTEGNQLSQGFEQPLKSTLKRKLVLEGYYSKAGSIKPVLINKSSLTNLNQTKTDVSKGGFAAEIEFSVFDNRSFSGISSIFPQLFSISANNNIIPTFI